MLYKRVFTIAPFHVYNCINKFETSHATNVIIFDNDEKNIFMARAEHKTNCMCKSATTRFGLRIRIDNALK